MLPTALLAALALAAPGGAPLTVGFVGPLTGGSAALGASLRNGARLAVEEVNAAGGVLGRPLRLVEADDQARPEQGAEAARALVEREGAVALIGPGNTGVANAINPVARNLKTPVIGPSATGSQVNELFAGGPLNFTFRLAASDAVQAKMMVTEAFAGRGRTRPAILADASPYGAQGLARLEALLAARGAKAVSVGTFPVGATDLSAPVKAAKEAGADVIFLYALGAEAAAAARAVGALGWKVDLIGTWNLANPVFLAGAGPAGDGAIMPQTFLEAAAPAPAQQAFLAAYRRRYQVAHVDLAPAAAQAYDAVKLLARALVQAKGTGGVKLRAALESLEGTYQGATGEYFSPWSSDDHEAVTPANVRWGRVKGGVVVVDER